MINRRRMLAARLAVRATARAFVRGSASAEAMQQAALVRLWLVTIDQTEREILREATVLVRKSKTARLINGRGDLWNGDDRSFQFSLLNEAARVRRAVVGANVPTQIAR